jgi:predicted HTH domain antitoxin
MPPILRQREPEVQAGLQKYPVRRPPGTIFPFGVAMSVRVSVELPEHAFSALRMTPEGFVAEMRLAAAVKWYELGLLSQSKAAEVVGVTRHELLDALDLLKVSPFQTSPEQLADELGRA